MVNENLRWYFGNGRSKILIGCCRLSGIENLHFLNDVIIQVLNQKGFFFLQQIIQGSDYGVSRWKSASDLGLDMRWENEWRRYINILKSLGICTSVEGDRLTWGGTKETEGMSAKGIYTTLI